MQKQKENLIHSYRAGLTLQVYQLSTNDISKTNFMLMMKLMKCKDALLSTPFENKAVRNAYLNQKCVDTMNRENKFSHDCEAQRFCHVKSLLRLCFVHIFKQSYGLCCTLLPVKIEQHVTSFSYCWMEILSPDFMQLYHLVLYSSVHRFSLTAIQIRQQFMKPFFLF